MVQQSISTPVSAVRSWSMPAVLLRVEGFAVLLAAIWLYAWQGYGGFTFALLLLAPDLSAAIYVLDKRAGSIAYNVVHTYTSPLALALFGLATGSSLALQLSLIWSAHIGLDRMLGYGLKYVGLFKETHLQRV